MRFPTCLGLVALAAAMAAPARAAETALPPLLVRLASIDTLTRQFFLLADKVGRKAEAEQMKNALQAATGPGGIEGLDPTKPIGIYGRIGPNGLDSTGVILVPSSDEAAMLKALKKLAGAIGGNLVESKEKGGAHTLNLDQSPMPIFLRFAKGYCWATFKDESAITIDKLPDPARLLEAPAGSVARLHFDLAAVPENLRATAVEAFKQGVAEAREKAPPAETAATKKFRMQLTDMMEGGLVQFLKEGGGLDLELVIDAKTEDVSLEARLDTLPGSSLTKAMQAMGAGESIGKAISAGGDAVSISSYMRMPQELRSAFMGVFEEALAGAKESNDSPQKQKVAKDMIAAVMPTLQSAVLDMGIALNPSKKEGIYNAAIGFRVAEGAKVETALRTAVKELFGEKAEGKVKLDFATYAGVKVHQFTGADDAKSREMLGDGPAYLAIRDDMVLVTAGPDALAMLKDMVSLKPEKGSMMKAELGLAAIARLGDSNVPKALVKKAADMAFAGKPGVDRARVEISTEKGFGIKVSANLATLEFLSIMDPNRNN
ncbi:MAG: hypothetical protein ACKO9Z_04750 [Planctomycetota bacterium]